MIDVLRDTRIKLQEAERLNQRASLRNSAFRRGAGLLAALLAAMLFDLLVPLPSVIRGVATLTLIGLAAHLLARRRAKQQLSVRLERAARILESRHPEIENALINAVQFEGQATQTAGHTADLMRREMARAEQLSAELSPAEAADITAVEKSRKRLMWLVGFACLSVVLFPRAYRFEVPRYLFFWRDNPPFTLTDFHVKTSADHVRSGGGATITVTIGGQKPETIALVTETAGKRANTPLFADDNGAFTQTLENLTDDVSFIVSANTGRSRQYLIHVDQAPRIRSIRVTMRPPAYTHRGPETVKVEDGAIRGLFGTSVDLEIESNRSLDSGRLTLSGPGASNESIALTREPGKPDRVRGNFVIRRAGQYRIDLAAQDAIATPNAARGEIVLQRDEKPLAYITAPGGNTIIAPGMKVPVKVEAEDDVAVQRVELHRIVNDAAENAQPMPIQPGEKHAESSALLDFKDLGVRPGDVIQYYATAYDNDPGRPNLTDSDRYWVWVVSDDDYRKIVEKQRGAAQVAAEYRALTDSLSDIASRQSELAKQAEKQADQPDKLDVLRKQQAALNKEARDLSRAMKELAARKPQYDLEKPLKEKLADIDKQLDQAVAGPMSAAAQSKTMPEAARQADAAARALDKAANRGRETVEKAIKALEAAAPLYQDVAMLQEITKKQGDLARQARQIAGQVKRDSFANARLDDLNREQAALRQALDKVQQDLQEHAEQCRSSNPTACEQGRALATAVDRLTVSDSMRSAEKEFGAKRPPEGAGHAETAQHALESLFKQCKQCQNGLKRGLNGQSMAALGQGAGDTLDQLARNGMGQGTGGQGQGGGAGMAGNPAPKPGSRPGNNGQSSSGGQALSMMMPQMQPAGGSRRDNKRGPKMGALPLPLAPQDVERITETARKPADAADRDSSRYPTEYRKLVKDYFRAVAGGK